MVCLDRPAGCTSVCGRAESVARREVSAVVFVLQDGIEIRPGGAYSEFLTAWVIGECEMHRLVDNRVHTHVG